MRLWPFVFICLIGIVYSQTFDFVLPYTDEEWLLESKGTSLRRQTLGTDGLEDYELFNARNQDEVNESGSRYASIRHSRLVETVDDGRLISGMLNVSIRKQLGILPFWLHLKLTHPSHSSCVVS